MDTKCRICGKSISQNEAICDDCASTADPIILASYGYKPIEPKIKSNVNKSSRKIFSDNYNDNKDNDPLDDSIGASKPACSTSSNKSASTKSTNNNYIKKSTIKPPKATKQQKKSAKSSSTKSGMCLITGVARNVMQDVEKRGKLYRWFRSLFKFKKYNTDPDITQFQIYPDFTGKTKNTSGNVADQVIIYGKIPSGIISENNNVEVWGKRNRDGIIVANFVKNSATGAVGKPKMCFSPIVIWILTLLIIALLILGILSGVLFIILGIILFIILLPWILKGSVLLFGLIFKAASSK